VNKKLLPRSKLRDGQVRRLVELFALEVPALKAAKVVKVNRHTAARVYDVIRVGLARECERESPLGGEVEIDESYFGGRRKGKVGRGAAGKVPVFGILRRNGQVYTRIVRDVARETLRKVVRTKVVPASVIYSDGFRSYDGLVLDGFRHYRINHETTFALDRKNHINGIESFWSYAKTQLRRYHGIPSAKFYLYLKEIEYRFNHRHQNIKALIIKTLKR
jgi:transposase